MAFPRPSLLFILFLFGFAASPAAGQPAATQRYQPVEITLTSDQAYPHPHRDVQLDAIFEAPDGQTFKIGGFWDGDRTYRVRFAPPTTGTWTYRTVASDTGNRGLHDQHGTFAVTPYTGDDPFARHGWLRVSDDGRYLTYEDGTPFFYLADMAWEIAWRSTPDEVQVYLADRTQKGFTAVQLVTTSHIFLLASGIENQQLQPAFLNDDFSRPNPRYFDYLDDVIDAINAQGMIAAVVPIWARLIELHHRPGEHPRSISTQDALLLARYVGARYAAHNVLWILGGDASYKTAKQRAFWTDFADVIRTASGEAHLVTIHPDGGQASFTYFDQATSWLDLHMYHSSHIAGSKATATYQQALAGYKLFPPKPLVNAEPVFEDFVDEFWKYVGREDIPEAARITAEHVRRASYESVLSGSLVGVTYGGNGVWQWANDAFENLFWPRTDVLEALALPGSTHLSLLKTLMERYRWYDLVPHPEWVVEQDAADFLPLAANTDILLAYFPTGLSRAVISTRAASRHVARSWWIDPTTGDRTEGPSALTPLLTANTPDDRDWLLAATLAPLPPDQQPDAPISITGPAPHPFSRKTRLVLGLWEPGTVKVSVWDLLGREILTTQAALDVGTHHIPLRIQTPGVYLYRLDYRTQAHPPYATAGTMVNLGRP